MFSVIIPTFNSEKTIERCVRSVMGQSCSDFEIIIVNDGSSDKTLDVLEKIKDSRITIVNQKNTGVSQARNNGIKASTGDWICFLDSDDEWCPNHLDELNSAIARFPERSFFVTLSKTVLLNGETIRQCTFIENKEPFYIDDFLEFEIKNGYRKCFNTCCVCAHRRCFNSYGYFEIGVGVSEDVDMWNRIMLFEGLVIVPKETVLRNRDYSFSTRSIPVGNPFYFNTRISAYLDNPEVSPKRKEELRLLYNRMELSSARSFISFGFKKKGLEVLKRVRPCYVPKTGYLLTCISLFIPSWFLKKHYLRGQKNYFKD